MTYLVLDLIFLAAAVALMLALTVAPRRRVRLVPALAAGAALLALTAVFDNLMIAAGLFGYAPEALSGAALFQVPIEDFAYPVAAAVLVPALWHRFAAPGPTPGRAPEPEQGSAPKPSNRHAEGRSR